MTRRELVLAIVLGTVIVLGGGGLFGYLLVLSPLQAKQAQAERLRVENGDKTLELLRVQKDKPRLDAAVRRSLPADIDIARQEYEAAIRQIFRDARVTNLELTVRGGDPRSAPELPIDPLKPNQKRYAYTPVQINVAFKRAKLATVIDVLSRYYRLNLLQQITAFTVKKADDVRPQSGYRLLADTADLDVSFTTEAISVFDAEKRQTLLPIPYGFAALGGQASYVALTRSPQTARAITPLQISQILASNGRDYSLVLVKDVFHGPPPPPPPPVRPEPPPPKDDTSGYIRVVSAVRSPGGEGFAIIQDVASAQEYEVTVKREGEKLVPEVVKSYRTITGTKKTYDPEPDLDISESTSSTAVKFRIVGLSDSGLVLALKSGKPPGVPVGRRGNAPPAEEPRVFHWRNGQPLSQIEEVTGAERAELLAIAESKG